MRTALLTLLLTGAFAHPVLAHPGHGLPGWLHHGELLVVASVVLTAMVVRRLGAARTGRRGDDR